MDHQLGLLVRYQNASLQAKEAVSSTFGLGLLCLILSCADLFVSGGSFMDDQLGLLTRYQNASLQAKEAVSSASRLGLLCLILSCAALQVRRGEEAHFRGCEPSRMVRDLIARF